MYSITYQSLLTPYVLILIVLFITLIVISCLIGAICIWRNGIRQKHMQDELNKQRMQLDYDIENWLHERCRILDNR